MALTSGSRLGHYEVGAQIGAGGMGEVYRARDTRLGRQVALKVLPALFLSNPERVARFQREAQTLASLNHPNIAAIHGLEHVDGMTALVLELVEGPTLADRLVQGPVPVDDALTIAQQIADALEAAHDQGIIHRDLKPANIKLRPDGAVKVLDFGLAKAIAPEPIDASDSSKSLTVTTPAVTLSGVIMGTAAYMSPEQARGRPLDKRTDIWAFGCVLYEMLSGRRPFADDDVASVLAAILTREPDWSALPATLPSSIRRLIGRCLQKNPKDRLRDIGDARIEIQDAETSAVETVAVSGSGTRLGRRERAVWVAALGVVALVAAVAIERSLRPLPAGPEVRFEINTPAAGVGSTAVISPDGTTVAFVGTSDQRLRLWIRRLDATSARVLPGTDAAQYPFWSPDSRSLGFFAESRLKLIDIDGGTVRTLTSVYRGTGGTWNQDGVILFSSLGDPIARISEGGGDAVELAGLVQQGSNFEPKFLPDGRRFLYYVRGTPEARGVYVGDLNGPTESRRLVESDGGAVYSPPGRLLFVRQGTILSQAFDPDSLQIAGSPIAVVPAVSDCRCVGASVSDTGSIVYRTTSGAEQTRFVWFDRDGKQLGEVGSAPAMGAASMSADGRYVAGYRGNPADGNIDVWVLDVDRGTPVRLTDHAADDVSPVWSPRGDRVAYSSNASGTHDIFLKPAGGGREELLLASEHEKIVSDWSADGGFLLFDTRDLNKRSDIWALPLRKGAPPFPVVETNFEEQRGQFSPEGNWIAYQSDESGRQEVYLQPFPGGGTKRLVSTSGGSQVRWRRDGKELFYVDPDGRLMAVPINLATSDPAPQVGKPTPLFAPPLGSAVQRGDFRHRYMVSNDGRRFLVAVTSVNTGTSSITVILNWKPRA